MIACEALESYVAKILCPDNIKYFYGGIGGSIPHNYRGCDGRGSGQYYVGQLMNSHGNEFYITMMGRDSKIRVVVDTNNILMSPLDACGKILSTLRIALSDPCSFDLVISVARQTYEGIKDELGDTLVIDYDRIS